MERGEALRRDGQLVVACRDDGEDVPEGVRLTADDLAARTVRDHELGLLHSHVDRIEHTAAQHPRSARHRESGERAAARRVRRLLASQPTAEHLQYPRGRFTMGPDGWTSLSEQRPADEHAFDHP